MGIRHAVLRGVFGVSLVLLGIGAAPASAQTYPGGGNATLAFAVTNPKSIVYGGTAKYAIKITNNGPDLASDVKLASVTLPAAPDGVSTLKVTALSGCTPEDATGNSLFPCDINANMNTPTPQTVTVTVTWVSTDANDKFVLPTTCPATTDTLGDVKFSFTTTTTTPTYDVLASSAGTTVAVKQYADLGIAIDGPTFGTVGGSNTYTVTVKNSGPCAAANVVVSPLPGNLLTFQSGTGATCTTAAEMADPNGCTPIANLPPGQSVTFQNTYKISALPDSVTQTTIPVEYDVATDTSNVNADGGVATTGIRVGKEGGGCSSGGPGGLLAVALMAAAVFAARRRRTA